MTILFINMIYILFYFKWLFISILTDIILFNYHLTTNMYYFRPIDIKKKYFYFTKLSYYVQLTLYNIYYK